MTAKELKELNDQLDSARKQLNYLQALSDTYNAELENLKQEIIDSGYDPNSIDQTLQEQFKLLKEAMLELEALQKELDTVLNEQQEKSK